MRIAERRLWEHIPFALAVAGAIVGFSAMYLHCYWSFSNPQEDMSFGWFVPLFSLYVLYCERGKLAREIAVGAPSIVGALACLPAFAVALLGTRGMQIRFEQIGFIVLCITMPWAFYGRRFAKLFVFPALYLVFTIPLSSFLDIVTIHLRMLASSTALVVLQGFGADVVRQGTMLVAGGAHPFSIDVASPCSGLRSIFALMALTAAYSWYDQPTWPRRALLFAFSVPLAILGNVMRILSICLVAGFASADFALGFYHDYSGYVVFLVAVSLMVAVGGVITRCCRSMGLSGKASEAKNAADEQACSGRSASSLLTSCVFAVIFLSISAFQYYTPESAVTEAPCVELPAEMPGYISDVMYYCQRESCGESFTSSRLGGATVCPRCGADVKDRTLGELTILPKGTKVSKRLYKSTSSGMNFIVSVVVGTADKGSIHRPEVCLPAQGFAMSSPKDIDINGRPCHFVSLERGMSRTIMCYTFFNQAGYCTSSHIRRIVRDVFDRSVLNRVDRWVMFSISAISVSGCSTENQMDMKLFTDFLSELYASTVIKDRKEVTK